MYRTDFNVCLFVFFCLDSLHFILHINDEEYEPKSKRKEATTNQKQMHKMFAYGCLSARKKKCIDFLCSEEPKLNFFENELTK